MFAVVFSLVTVLAASFGVGACLMLGTWWSHGLTGMCIVLLILGGFAIFNAARNLSEGNQGDE